jgi:hypothetical protein
MTLAEQKSDGFLLSVDSMSNIRSSGLVIGREELTILREMIEALGL